MFSMKENHYSLDEKILKYESFTDKYANSIVEKKKGNKIKGLIFMALSVLSLQCGNIMVKIHFTKSKRIG